MDSFREMGRVDLASANNPFRANNNDTLLLVNGAPQVIDLNDWDKLKNIDITRDPLYRSLVRKYPKLELWADAEFVTVKRTPTGGQQFTIKHVLLNGCHACEIGGHAYFSYDFDASGRFLGVRFLRLSGETQAPHQEPNSSPSPKFPPKSKTKSAQKSVSGLPSSTMLQGDFVGFSPDSRYIATQLLEIYGIEGRYTTKIWEAAKGRLILSLNEKFAAFSPGSSYLMTSYSSGGGYVLRRLAGGELVGSASDLKSFAEFFPGSKSADRIESPDISRDQKFITDMNDEGTVTSIRDAKNKRLIRSFEGRFIDFSPDGELIATRAKSVVKIWEITGGRLLSVLDCWGEIKFSPDWSAAATEIYDYNRNKQGSLLKLWDPRSGRLIASIDGVLSSNGLFHPNKHVIATETADNKSTRIWDIKTGESLQTLEGGFRGFSSDGRLLKTEIWWDKPEHSTKVWQSESGRLVAQFEGYPVAFSPDGSLILTGFDKRVKVWPLPPSPGALTRTDQEKWKTFIRDQFKLIIQMPHPKRGWQELVTLTTWGKFDTYQELYLLAVNRRSLSADALSSAEKFLKKGDLENVKKYAGLSVKHYAQSNELLNAADQVFSSAVGMNAQSINALYRGAAEASKYGWFMACGPKCYEVADYVFLMTDFAVDNSLDGPDEAAKNLLSMAITKALLGSSGFSAWIETRTTHLIENSGLHDLIYRAIDSHQTAVFQKAVIKVLAESGAYAAGRITGDNVQKAVTAALDFVLSSSNRQMPPSKSVEPASQAASEIVVAAFENVDGNQFMLVPFLLYHSGQYTAIPQDIGDVPENNKKTLQAKKDSILNRVKTFEVYRKGKKVGSVFVTEIAATFIGAIPKVVGLGKAAGFQFEGGEIAMSRAISQEGFRSPPPLKLAQRKRLRALALGLLPKTIPRNNRLPKLTGKRIVIGAAQEQLTVLDMDRDGNPEVSLEISAPLQSPGGHYLVAHVYLLARYDNRTGEIKKLFDSAYIAPELLEPIYGESMPGFWDLVDVDGDGIAEIILSKGYGEVGSLEIFTLRNGQPHKVCVIPDWSGS
ncbi:MAG: hypothetical protein MOB07_27410 [Acidobacteria bacterium]|nr:hypothetical protein [Acidobacteriota bacterium]